MASKLPHMPLWVYDLDTDRDCRRMSDAEFGRYMRLLIRQWIEGSVPADAAEAIQDAMLDPGSEDSVRSLLDRKFSEKDGSVRRNGRLAEERDHAEGKVVTNQANGRKGGRPRKTERLSESKPNGSIRAYGSDSGSESESSEGEGCKGEGGSDGGGARPPDDLPVRVFGRHDWPQNRVAEIYSQYPKRRRGGHVDAHRAIRDALTRIQAEHGLDVPDAMEYLAERVRLYAQSPEGRGDYVQKMRNWLDEGSYDLDPECWNGGSADGVPEHQRRAQEQLARLKEKEGWE